MKHRIEQCCGWSRLLLCSSVLTFEIAFDWKGKQWNACKDGNRQRMWRREFILHVRHAHHSRELHENRLLRGSELGVPYLCLLCCGAARTNRKICLMHIIVCAHVLDITSDDVVTELQTTKYGSQCFCMVLQLPQEKSAGFHCAPSIRQKNSFQAEIIHWMHMRLLRFLLSKFCHFITVTVVRVCIQLKWNNSS